MYDALRIAHEGKWVIVPGTQFQDGATALESAVGRGARVVEFHGEVLFAKPVQLQTQGLELRVPADADLVVDHGDPLFGLGGFGVEDVTIVGRGRVLARRYVAGQTILGIASNRATIGGGLTIELRAKNGAGAPMRALWLNGCTEASIEGLRILPNRNLDCVVVDGGSRLSIDDLRITNGSPGAIESYVPRKARSGVTIRNCFDVDVGRYEVFGVGTTAAQGEDLPLEWALKIVAAPGQEYGHVDVRALRNFSFNCKVGLWLCGTPWVNVADGCYFCTQGVLCREDDHAAILLDSHDSTDASSKWCGPVTIGKVHLHNIGLQHSSGIYVKRARDVTIAAACVTDVRNRCAVRIRTPTVRNVAVADLTALLAPDATADSLAPVVLEPGVANGITVGAVHYGSQVADGVGPAPWTGPLPVAGVADVGGTLRVRGLWDQAQHAEPNAGTQFESLVDSVPFD